MPQNRSLRRFVLSHSLAFSPAPKSSPEDKKETEVPPTQAEIKAMTKKELYTHALQLEIISSEEKKMKKPELMQKVMDHYGHKKED